jgi:TonB-dependent receptor
MRKRQSVRTTALGGASLASLAVMALTGPVWAQTAAPGAPAAASDDTSTQVVVVGVRKALKTAQQIKKDAATEVDSITATDIGAFPDKSVSEALQRVPGITVSRLQSSDDSSHFSAEPSQVLIRGLTFVRTEFNGRDSFSADANRGLNFNDISPELMAGVDSYKNETADMIEGGIAGTVNLRTRLPFDSKGQVISVSANADDGSTSKKGTYEYSGIYSNTWNTSAGRFGILADYANSHILTQTQAVVMQRIGAFCSSGYGSSANPTVNADGSIPCTATPYGGADWQYMPDEVNYSQVTYDRQRHGTALAFQYENNEKTVDLTVQYNDSFYRNAWLERSVNVGLFGLWAAPAFAPQTSAFIAPAPNTPNFTFGSNGMLTSGVLTQPVDDWAGASQADYTNDGSAVPGQPFVNYCGASHPCASAREGLYVEDQARDFNHSEGTKDLSTHLTWKVSDRLKADFDVQYIKATTNNYDILVANDTMADAVYNVDKHGTPQIQLTPDSNNNYAPGFLGNPHNYFPHFIQDHYEDNKATETALRADFEYRFPDEGWLGSLKAGVRYADRDQRVRYTTYNWSPVAANWNCNGYGFNIDNTQPAPANPPPGACDTGFKGYGAGIWTSASLGDFYNGQVFPNGNMVFLSKAELANHDKLINDLSGKTTGSPIGWTPLCQRPTNTDGCFIPAEELNVTEKTNAVYAMLTFGGNDKTLWGGITVVGNAGLRYVETEDTGQGGVAYPTSTWYNQVATTPCNAPLGPNSVTNLSCWLTPDLLNFSNGASAGNALSKKHSNLLPSFNIRFGLTDTQFVRFGASRALSRPDFGQLRNYVGLNAPALDSSPNSAYVIWNDPNGPHTASNVKGYNFQFNGDSGYVGLAPITADQFDLTYETYFKADSSFTADLFFKRLNGSIQFGKFLRSFTNNGATETVLVRGPVNGKGGGELSGFELAYQTFFDFLPGLWSGLGLQANYTHTHQHGINNSNLANEPGYIAGSTVAFGGGDQVNGAVIDSHRLAGISDDSYNLVGLYEKGRIAARLAYSWRSAFLTDNLDCCIGLPIWEKANGFLDGSLRYKLNDNIELSLDGSNLLNTTTVMQQQVQGDSSQTPGAKPVRIDSSWIRSDRRVTLGVRLKY